MNYLKEFLTSNQFPFSDDLIEIEKKLVDSDNTNLEDSEKLLEIIKKSIPHLDASQLIFFRHLNDAKDLISFFAKQTDFANKIRILNSDVEGQKYDKGLLTNLKDTYELIHPILQFIQDKSSFSFPNFCQTASKNLQSGSDDFETKMKKIEDVASKMFHINNLIGRTSGYNIENVLPFVLKLKETGIYKSRSSMFKLGKEFFIEFNPDKENNEKQKVEVEKVPVETLQDLVRGIRLFISQDNLDKEKIKIIKEFVAIFPIAEKIHNLLLKLEECGHPDFVGKEISMNEKGKISEQLFKEEKEKYKTKFKEWKNLLEQAFKKIQDCVF